MGMKSKIGLLAMVAAFASPSIGSGDIELPQTSTYKRRPKTKLTKKQKKVRSKNKMAKQSRKKNRR
jgi:hypothetical protein